MATGMNSLCIGVNNVYKCVYMFLLAMLTVLLLKSGPSVVIGTVECCLLCFHNAPLICRSVTTQYCLGLKEVFHRWKDGFSHKNELFMQ